MNKWQENKYISPTQRLCALIDLDGTMFHGSKKIEGADQLITALHEWKVPVLFVTNNSTRTPQQVAELLQSMGIPAQEQDVLTSSQAAVSYIVQHYPNEQIFMIGEQGLMEALTAAGLEWKNDASCIYDGFEPGVVVQGLDRNFSYAQLEAAAHAIRKGARFIATNPDLMLPSDKGISPGSGTLTAAIEAASGQEPFMIGKPHRTIMEVALQRLGCTSDEAIVIGDNMLTDIMAGAHANCHTALVLTGVTTAENYKSFEAKAGITPDLICEDLASLKQWFADRRGK